MLKAIIFDMDGVLVNSTKYIWESFNILLSRDKIHIHNEEIKKYLGMSLKDQLKSWNEDYGIENHDVEEFSKKAREIEMRLMRKEVRPNKDLNNLLEQARKSI